MVQLVSRGEDLAEVQLANGRVIAVPSEFVAEGKAGTEVSLTLPRTTAPPSRQAAQAQGGNAQRAYQFYVNRGLAPHQAAGLVGNLMQESGSQLNPTAVGDQGSAFGIAQWRGQRFANLRTYANALGADWKNTDVQLGFTLHEMGIGQPLEGAQGFGSEEASGRRLLQSTDVRQATEAAVGYERPRGYSVERPSNAHGFQNRLRFAQGLTGESAPLTTAATDIGTVTAGQRSTVSTRGGGGAAAPELLGRAAAGGRAARSGDFRTRGEAVRDVIGGALSGLAGGGGRQISIPAMPNLGQAQAFQQQASAGPLPQLGQGIGMAQPPKLGQLF